MGAAARSLHEVIDLACQTAAEQLASLPQCRVCSVCWAQLAVEQPQPLRLLLFGLPLTGGKVTVSLQAADDLAAAILMICSWSSHWEFNFILFFPFVFYLFYLFPFFFFNFPIVSYYLFPMSQGQGITLHALYTTLWLLFKYVNKLFLSNL